MTLTPNTARIRALLRRRTPLRQKLFGVDITAAPGHYASALKAILPTEGELRPADMAGPVFDLVIEADRIHAERTDRETWDEDLIHGFHAAIDTALADFGAALDAAMVKFDARAALDAAESTYREYVAAHDTAEFDVTELRKRLVARSVLTS